MNTTTYELLLVGTGVVLNAAANYFNSRKIHLQGAEMSRLENAVTAVENLVGGLRGEIQTLRDEDTGDLDQAGQNALADRLERLVSPVEENPPAAAEPEADGEVVTDPATNVVAEPEAEVTDGE